MRRLAQGEAKAIGGLRREQAFRRRDAQHETRTYAAEIHLLDRAGELENADFVDDGSGKKSGTQGGRKEARHRTASTMAKAKGARQRRSRKARTAPPP